MAFGEDRSEFSSRKVGTKQVSIRFIPRPNNTAFDDGDIADFEYSHHYRNKLSQDQTRLVIFFTGDKVTITGRNLLTIANGIKAHQLDVVEQGEGMQNAIAEGAVVEEMTLEPIGEEG